jgi:hypothetical protein
VAECSETARKERHCKSRGETCLQSLEGVTRQRSVDECEPYSIPRCGEPDQRGHVTYTAAEVWVAPVVVFHEPYALSGRRLIPQAERDPVVKNKYRLTAQCGERMPHRMANDGVTGHKRRWIITAWREPPGVLPLQSQQAQSQKSGEFFQTCSRRKRLYFARRSLPGTAATPEFCKYRVSQERYRLPADCGNPKLALSLRILENASFNIE